MHARRQPKEQLPGVKLLHGRWNGPAAPPAPGQRMFCGCPRLTNVNETVRWRELWSPSTSIFSPSSCRWPWAMCSAPGCPTRVPRVTSPGSRHSFPSGPVPRRGGELGWQGKQSFLHGPGASELERNGAPQLCSVQ